MPFEKGGRADKQGNRYEIHCIIYEILKILNETNYSVVIEALGVDEVGTDILVTTFDGEKEHQQCKARNASKEYWGILDLKGKGIFSTWKTQLNRDNNRRVSLVSPIAFSVVDYADIIILMLFSEIICRICSFATAIKILLFDKNCHI